MHTITVSQTVERLGRSDLALAALMHDAHEGYACDIPAPLKKVIEHCYTPVAVRLDAAIGEALGIEFPKARSADKALIDAADRAIFVVEAEELLPDRGQAAIARVEIDPEALAAARAVVAIPLPHVSFEDAAAEFTRAHERLAARP